MATIRQITEPYELVTEMTTRAATKCALTLEAGLAAVREWEAEHGVLTSDELAWADALLDVADSGERLHEAD